jgi:hypothetical protein
MNISPGNKVGVRGYGPEKNLVKGGPYTIRGRPVNPHNQHMWEFTNHPAKITERNLFPWKNGLKRNDPVPKPKTVANVTMNKARNAAMRKVWGNFTNTNSTPGTGPLNLIKKFTGNYKPGVGGRTKKSHKRR